MPTGSISDKAYVFGVRERDLYRLKGQPLREISNSIVTEIREQVYLKVEQLKGSQPSGSAGKDQPSKTIKKDSWYEMAM
jgi:hypothetical protein